MAKKKQKSWSDIIQSEIDIENRVYELYDHQRELQDKVDAASNTLSEKQYVRANYKDRHIGSVIAKSAVGITIACIIVSLLLIYDGDKGGFAIFIVAIGALTPFVAVFFWIIKRLRVKKKIRREFAEQYVPMCNKIEAEAMKARQEMETLKAEIVATENKHILPEGIRPHLKKLLEYFENARAHTLEDAVALLEKEIGQAEELENLRVQLDQAMEAKYAALDEWNEMRQARAAAEAAENEAWWLELDESMRYLNRS